MKIFEVEIIQLDGRKTISVKGFVLSYELEAIKQKLGDINKYPVGKKLKIQVLV